MASVNVTLLILHIIAPLVASITTCFVRISTLPEKPDISCTSNDTAVDRGNTRLPTSFSAVPLELLARNRGSLDIDAEAWNTATTSACIDALTSAPKGILDPSGLAMCYNLPSLDNSTGSFRAELRLYRLAFPIEDWNDIGSQTVAIDLRYDDAAIFDSSLSGVELSSTASSQVLELSNRYPPEMELLRTLNFVGQLHDSLLQKPMNL